MHASSASTHESLLSAPWNVNSNSAADAVVDPPLPSPPHAGGTPVAAAAAAAAAPALAPTPPPPPPPPPLLLPPPPKPSQMAESTPHSLSWLGLRHARLPWYTCPATITVGSR